jgi:hypothetical protein
VPFMITNTPLAVAFAKSAILARMDQGNFTVVDLMQAAAEHVDSFHDRKVRMDLRDFIKHNGGSLTPPALRPNVQPQRKAKPPTAVTYADAKANQCQFPVGEWDGHTPSHNYCCGEILPATKRNLTVSKYCEACAKLVHEVSNPRKAPPLIPPSARTNLAYRNRGRRGSPRLEGY